jgi:hypothetical protein
MREWNRFVEIFYSSFSTFCCIFEIFFYSFASLCRVFETFSSFFSKLNQIFEIIHSYSSKFLTFFRLEIFSSFFLRNCDVWSKKKSEKRDIKKMRACLMIVLDKISIEWVFERQQETFFCFLRKRIDLHDSIFFFEQTIVSLAVRLKSFWVKACKEEEDKFIIDKNVFRDSIWGKINIHRKCIRWYASSLECFHARAQSNLH